jgi:DinB superfamily
MSSIGPSLVTAFDYVWQRFVIRIGGLTDEEYFWEPTDDCWTIRKDSNGAWMMDGEGLAEQPDPAPLTTIAWRMAHIGRDVLGGFAANLFGADVPRLVSIPGSVAGIEQFLDDDYQAWRSGMEGIGETEWWDLLGPKWKPWDQSNKVDLALHVFDELVHHTAEVGLLRDLYAHRDALGRL